MGNKNCQRSYDYDDMFPFNLFNRIEYIVTTPFGFILVECLNA